MRIKLGSWEFEIDGLDLILLAFFLMLTLVGIFGGKR